MPVLSREPAFWPETLFDAGPFSCSADRWLAYQVRPRTEKVVARYLRGREIAYFLPQIERRQRYQRRMVCSHLILFPGYVFALVDEERAQQPLGCKAIIRPLAIDDQERIDRELRDVQRLILSGRPLTREDRLQPGSSARIMRGPLAGVCGRVVKNKRGQRFMLEVQFLQRAVSIEIDSTMIEAL